MLSRRQLLFLAFIALVAPGFGCGSGGGGGSSSSSSSSSTGGGGNSNAASFTGPSTGTATGQILYPGRGTFISGSPSIVVNGTAAAQTGIASVSINGQAATLTGGGGWSIPATLGFGLNTFTIDMTDNVGQQTVASWSVVYSPSYLDPTRLVPDAGALRASENAVHTLAPIAIAAVAASPTFQQAIQGAAGSGSGGVTINSLSFGTPSGSATLVNGGAHMTIDVPNLDVNATYIVTENITATNMQVDAIVDIAVSNGAFVATISGTPTVSFINFQSSPLGPTLVEPVITSAVVSAIQSDLPTQLTKALNDALAPRTFSIGPSTATLTLAPDALSISTAEAYGTGDANVVVAVTANATPNTGPGSPSRNGATAAAPALASARDVSIALREDIVNRILYSAWAAGALNIRVDQAFLAAHGVTLPFALDSTMLAAFFPSIASLNGNAGPMPVAFVVDPALPPVLAVTGSPDLLTAGFGEVHFKLQVDPGTGFVDVLELIVQAEMGASVGVANNEVTVTLGQPKAEIDLVQLASGLSAADVKQFVSTILPPVLTLATSQIPPIPLPALPGGLQLRNVDVHADGSGGDFVTIDGDL